MWILRFAFRHKILSELPLILFHHIIYKISQFVAYIILYSNEVYYFPWNENPFEDLLPVDIQYLILEYSGYWCHMCGRIVSLLLNKCEMGWTTCTNCVQYCAYHKKICCNCCIASDQASDLLERMIDAAFLKR